MTELAYKPLPAAFRRQDYDYQLEGRTAATALYSYTLNGCLCGYEVVRVQRHDGRTIGGTALAPAEYLPSDAEWGSKGWSYSTFGKADGQAEAMAVARFLELETYPAATPAHA